MTRPVALRILALAAVVGLVAQALLLDSLLGLNVPILVGGVLALAFAIRPRARAMDPGDRWLPPAAVVLSVAVAVRADPTLLGIDLLAICALVGASVAAIGGEAVTRRTALGVVELGFVVIGWAAAGILRVSAALARPADVAGVGSIDGAEAGDRRGSSRRLPAPVVPILRGLLLAIPALIVFAGLFSAADLAFDRLMAGLFTWDVDLGMVPVRLAFAFLIAWGVAGLLGVAAGALADPGSGLSPAAARPPIARSLGAAAAGLPSAATADGSKPLLRIGAIEAATVLVAVDILFAVFVLLQVRYLFGGQDSLAVTGLPYAQYARSGFFELVWVAFLAGGLLATVHALAARRTRVLVGAGVALMVLTAAVLVSALIRLGIYLNAYGWTELRFYVLAAIVWLGVGIAIAIVLLVRDRMGWLLHGLAMAALAVLVAVNLVGPSRTIAEENVARVLNPALVPPDGQSGLDIGYAAELGDDAIPAMVRALPALAPRDRADLLGRLRDRRDALAEPEARAWTGWNLGREAAKAALETLPAR